MIHYSFSIFEDEIFVSRTLINHRYFLIDLTILYKIIPGFDALFLKLTSSGPLKVTNPPIKFYLLNLI